MTDTEIEKSLACCPLPGCGSTDIRYQTHGITCRSCGLWLGNSTQSMEKGGFISLWNKRDVTKK